MNNDTNNNLNGTVLGSVDSNVNGIQEPNFNQEIETLDVNATTPNNVEPVQPMSEQNTFFNNPPVNDMEMNNTGVVNEMTNAQPKVVEETPQPMPAYTNPQYINPNPMPGFENPNMIGTTPPISLEQEKKPKKKGNKILFILLVLLVLAGVGFGTYYVLNYTDLLTKKESVTISVKELELSIGDSLSTNINDYANINGTDIKNCSLNTTSVDVTKVGVYEYTVKCGEITKIGKITVVDNAELVVNTQKVYKVKGDTLEAKEFVTNIDETLTYEFVEPEVVNTLMQGEKGTYAVKIKASNSSKNKEVEGTLVIMEYPIKGYLTCSTNEQNVAGLSAVMTVSERFAILNDGNNGYGGIASEIHTFKFSDETEYTNYLAEYKTNDKVTVNEVTGNATFNDETLTITISNEKDNNEVISEYGEATMEKYQTIRSYFVDTLKYTCTYKNNG